MFTAYLAAVFIKCTLQGFVIFPAGQWPAVAGYPNGDTQMWMVARSRSIPYLLRCAAEYRRGRHFNHQPMTKWKPHVV